MSASKRRVVRLRRRHGQGPAVIAHHVGLPSTCWRILKRHGISRMQRPGPAHPPANPSLRARASRLAGARGHQEDRQDPRRGRGWRAHGRGKAGRRQRVAYEYVHAAVDDHSRLAYAEALPGHDGATCAAFWRRAAAFFADHGIHVERVMTDNDFEYVRFRPVKST